LGSDELGSLLESQPVSPRIADSMIHRSKWFFIRTSVDVQIRELATSRGNLLERASWSNSSMIATTKQLKGDFYEGHETLYRRRR
jgi:hypothetical protein